MHVEKVAFVAAPNPEARAALERLSALYPSVSPEEADVVVALGGDGFMLHTLHDFMDGRKPIFGMNRGSVGFMMNEYREDGLVERLGKAETFKLHPLQMKAYDLDGNKHTALAINEVSLHRETRQAAKIRIFVDGIERMEEMICDGVLVSTAAGSTAYNLSASGPIIPLGAKLLAVTPISAFRPRRWRGALLPSRAAVAFEVIDPDDRRVSATADYTEYRDVRRVEVAEDRSHSPMLMFDPEHNLEERVLKEQFSP